MGAILDMNPSLIGYLGGVGKAFGHIGKSMNDINQAKLDLDKQAADQKYRDDMYKLSLNADARAADSVTTAKENTYQKENDQLAASRFMAKRIGLPLGEEVEGQTDPEVYAQNSAVLRGLGVDGVQKLSPAEKKLKDILKGNDGTSVKIYADGSEEPVVLGGGQFYDSSRKKTDLIFKDNKPYQATTDIISGTTTYLPLDGKTEGQKGREEQHSFNKAYKVFSDGIEDKNISQRIGLKSEAELKADFEKAKANGAAVPITPAKLDALIKANEGKKRVPNYYKGDNGNYFINGEKPWLVY